MIMIKKSQIAALAIILSFVLSPLVLAKEKSERNESEEKNTEIRAESNLTLNNKNSNKYDSKKQNNQTLSGEIITISADNISFKSEDEATVYTVNVSSAPLKNLYGAEIQISALKTGDKIKVSGDIDENENNITAKSITDETIQTEYKKTEGKVTSIEGLSLILKAEKNKSFTINASSDTKITKNGRSAAFSDIKTGSKIKVAGNWDKTTNIITADNINITVKMYAIYFKGTLKEKNGNILTVLRNNGKTYSVDAGSAIIVYKYFGRGNISELDIGDKLQIIGKHEKKSMSVIAGLVRDYSRVKPAPVPGPSATPSPSPTVSPSPTASPSPSPTPSGSPSPSPNPTPSPTPSPTIPSFTAQQVSTHNTQSDCWVIMNGKVYNITSYIPNHPGGTGTITPYCGKDAAAAFGSISHSQNANNLLAGFFIGNLQ